MELTMGLGDNVRDIITGFTGVAILKQEGLFTCTEYKVQPNTLDDSGRPKDSVWFEETRLVKVGVGVGLSAGR